MSSPGLAMNSEMYETLSDIYLSLWRQLDGQAQENKWLMLRPENTVELQKEIRETIESLAADPSSAVSSDYTKTQELLLSGRANSKEVASFREYLRDTGLRFAELGDPIQ